VRAAHLTKEHRDEVVPTPEALGRSLSGMLPDGTSEVRAIDQSKNLRKATGDSYHNSTAGLWVTRRGNAVDGW